MKWRSRLPQFVLGALVICGVGVPQVQANSIWNYAGSGDGHTVTAFLELDFDFPVGAVTPFTTFSVVNSQFTISGPVFDTGVTTSSFTPGSFTFEHFTFTFPFPDMNAPIGEVGPPDNLGCAENVADACTWIYEGAEPGAELVQVLAATIFNGDDWEVLGFFGEAVLAGALSNGPDDNNFGEFLLTGTGQWTPQNSNPNPNPVPEPSTMLLLGSGLVGLVGWQMRKRKA
ncbi:MAG: PEP-CTERM sorting domain-containing protein [Nitrospirae bacterium]|nr:PEP-CTERM sorting domain-containing protein [Nitrospirota bacterium]MDA1304396.1 PEP-CTERM sorting domain-containing protein [Nitrospirota bacterium]